MELKPQETSAWVTGQLPAALAPGGQARALLLFGPDQGGVFEFARLAARASGDVETYPASDVDAGSVISSLSAGSLFGGATSVRLDGADDRQVARLEAILEAPFADGARLIVTAGEIKPASKLRKLFSSRKDCIAAPLYMMRERDIQSFAANFFRAEGLDLDRQATLELLARLSGDRAAAARSCEIVALHTRGREAKKVEALDIRAVLDAVDEDGLQAPFDFALDGRTADASTSCSRRLAAGESFVGLLRIFAMRAQKLRGLMEAGLSPRAAVDKAKPPIFWAEKDLVIRLLGKLNLAKMDRILEMIDATERRIIEDRIPADAAMPALLLDISRHTTWKDL